MQIIVYYSPHCACGPEPGTVGRSGLVWRDVTRHVGEAAALGVTRPPAVVVNGRLRWQGIEAARRLREGRLT
ncbi:MAG: hypothetical protein WCE70_07835 [Rhodanobacteraceae bacterium]